jgi:hypothetical protein
MIYVVPTNLGHELYRHLRARNMPTCILVVLSGHTTGTAYSSPDIFFLVTPTTYNRHDSEAAVVLRLRN